MPTPPSTAPNDQALIATPSALRRVVAASMAGTVVEWYEFFLYATAASLVFGTYFFPPQEDWSPVPGVTDSTLEPVALSRQGTVWSWSVNHYAPPEPYVAPDPFVPYTVVAVELAEEQMVVLGQLADGSSPDDLRIGMPVELVLGTLFVEPDSGDEVVVWKWRPVDGAEAADEEEAG